MKHIKCKFQAATITELFEGYSNENKNEFLDYFQCQLEERYGFDIEQLADMVFGKEPDITTAC